MSAPRPGWYPDPSQGSGSEVFRWWDGSSWTAERSDSATAPPPADPQPVDSAAAPAGSRRSGRSGRSWQSGQSRLAALLIGLSLVLSGGVVGFIGWSNLGDQRRTGAAGPTARSAPEKGTAEQTAPGRADRRGRPDARSNGPSGRLDEVTREAVLADARMVLPGHPYELVGDPVTVPGVFDAMFLAGAPVHQGHDGTGDWNATVGIGHIPADAWQGQDPKVFAERALAGVTAKFFGNHPTTVKQLRHGATMVDGQVCADVSAQVHYRVKGLPSRYDQVDLIGCPAANGTVITAISSVPDDADPELVGLAEKSLASLDLG